MVVVIGISLLVLLFLFQIISTVLIRAYFFRPIDEKGVNTTRSKSPILGENEESVSNSLRCNSLQRKELLEGMEQEQFYFIEGEDHSEPSVFIAASDEDSLYEIMEEAAKELQKEGSKPKNDIYLFQNKEIDHAERTEKVIEFFQRRGILPGLILIGEGTHSNSWFPGVKKDCAFIGVGEKGHAELEFSIEESAGQDTMLTPKSMEKQLEKAIHAIQNNPFSPRMIRPVTEMFRTVGCHATFSLKIIFANLWLFGSLLYFVMNKVGGEWNEMFRTTCTVNKINNDTMIHVQEKKAYFSVNVSLLGEDTIESVVERLHKLIQNDAINITLKQGVDPTGYANTNSEKYGALKQAILEQWSDVIVSPCLITRSSGIRWPDAWRQNLYCFPLLLLSEKERNDLCVEEAENGENEMVEESSKILEFYKRLFEKM